MTGAIPVSIPTSKATRRITGSTRPSIRWGRAVCAVLRPTTGRRRACSEIPFSERSDTHELRADSECCSVPGPDSGADHLAGLQPFRARARYRCRNQATQAAAGGLDWIEALRAAKLRPSATVGVVEIWFMPPAKRRGRRLTGCATSWPATSRRVCAYRGAGTQLAQSGLETAPPDVPTSAAAILRGALWPGREVTGLSHLSPPIAPSGQTRALLMIDPAENLRVDRRVR